MQLVAEAKNVSDLVSRLANAPARQAPQAPIGQVKFSSLVTQIIARQPASRKNDLEELMADLDSAERDFADEPSRDRYDSYKKAVKALCGLLISRSYRLHGYEDRKQRRYETLRVIDAALAELYSGLVRRNQDVIIALHLMGEIRGLIFDLKA